jgi:di/tricarboxylate transporter
VQQAKAAPLGLFDITWIGLPCAIVGLMYIWVVSPWLLPDRRPAIRELDDPREYTVEMVVEPGSGLVGKTIEEAGLRRLRGMFLMEIEREGMILAAVSPHERLRGDDRLVFVGIVESVVELQKIRGLQPATDQVFKLNAPRERRTLIEAVVSDTCPLVGMTIRDGRFRTVYNAVVIAVARNGRRIRKKIGDIVLETGDTLMLEAHPSFLDHQRYSRDFFLVSRVEGYTAPRHERAGTAGAIFLGMVILAGAELTSMLLAGMLAAGFMLLTRCLSSTIARKSVDWQVLTAIAASFAIGKAMEKTELAAAAVNAFTDLAGLRPWAHLAAIYLVTMICTELMSNNAAAALMFPIAMATSAALQASLLPFAVAVMFAASLGFATPLGYQTHLMVYGPGGYRFTDFLRMGIPLNLLMGVIAIPLIAWTFPF